MFGILPANLHVIDDFRHRAEIGGVVVSRGGFVVEVEVICKDFIIREPKKAKEN